jgi:hypothetical protein
VDNFIELIMPDMWPDPEWYRELTLELGLGLEIEGAPGLFVGYRVTVPLAAVRPNLASCGHPADADGQCNCASWPERAPALEGEAEAGGQLPLWPCPSVIPVLEDTLLCPHGYAWTPGVGWVHE